MWRNKIMKRIKNIESALWEGWTTWNRSPEYAKTANNKELIDDLYDKVNVQAAIIHALLNHLDVRARHYKSDFVALEPKGDADDRKH